MVLHSGDVNWTVDVPIVNDMDIENPETFSVSLLSESSRVVVDSNYSYIIITIVDNDSNCEYNILVIRASIAIHLTFPCSKLSSPRWDYKWVGHC